jgi:hypothetical protein
MAEREVTVNFFNNTPFTLRRESFAKGSGAWEVEPPSEIGPTRVSEPDNWKTVSNGFATGTSGMANYHIPGIPGLFMMGWANPFVGGNSYVEGCPPGFTFTRSGGGGNVANVGWEIAGEFNAGAGPFLKAPIRWINNKVYCFRGDAYMRYTDGNQTLPLSLDLGYPAPILGGWNGLGEAFPGGVDAVLVWPNGLTPGIKDKAYFFSGDKYVRYHMDPDPHKEGVDPEFKTPWVIAQHWNGLGQFQSFNGVDAALVWPALTPGSKTPSAFFFKGDQFVEYNLGQNEGIKQQPSQFKARFPGLGVFTHIDAALAWDTSKVLFVSGTKAVWYNVAADKVSGGPITITSVLP